MMAEQGGIAIRPARREEAARIVALIMLGARGQMLGADAIAAEAAHPAYCAAFDEVAASPDNAIFVAERDGVVIGTYQITLIPGLMARGRRRAKLESVHVAPECRGQGIGGRLIAHALGEARARGAGLVELTSNKDRLDAHRFYRTLGFAQSHEGFKLEL